MKAADFAYWLQGYFEINGEASALTKTQAQQVLKKAESVQAGSSEVETKAQSFVSYTQGVLFAAAEGVADQNFLKTATQKLKTKLNDLFVHAIDPSVSGDQQVLRETHRPNRPKRGDLEAMC